MNRLLTYRTPLLVLLLAFVLFDVGLPVVIATCPMEKEFGSCDFCHPAVPPQRVEIGLPGGSCCAPARIVERTTTDFEQVRIVLNREVSHEVVVAPMPSASLWAADVDIVVPRSWSPPLQTDIPILTSSLLI